jgi:protein-S-isoprenylcysteine O-methyltransferase Ste14
MNASQGPTGLSRHPSYTGALMAFLGLALLQDIGDQYRDYMNRTKRLIPAVY